MYLYEFQHSPSFLKDKRPSFVKSDHGDEIFSVFGYCFTVSHIKLSSKFCISHYFSCYISVHQEFQGIIFILGACTEEEERLDKIMMSYWGNFARTG